MLMFHKSRMLQVDDWWQNGRRNNFYDVAFSSTYFEFISTNRTLSFIPDGKLEACTMLDYRIVFS